MSSQEQHEGSSLPRTDSETPLICFCVLVSTENDLDVPEGNPKNALSGRSIVHALKDIIEFKEVFLKRVGASVESEYETRNVWNAFIMRYLQHPKTCGIFRHAIDISQDTLLAQHLQLKHFDFAADQTFFYDLTCMNAQIASTSASTIDSLFSAQSPIMTSLTISACTEEGEQINSLVSSNETNKQEISFSAEEKVDQKQQKQENSSESEKVYLENTNVELKKSMEIEQELKYEFRLRDFETLNSLHGMKNGKELNEEKTQLKMQQIFWCLFWYDYIGVDGGLQWAIGDPVYDLVEVKLRIGYEIFASPFNQHASAAARKQIPLQFFSLIDVDRCFGSLGNFFDTDFIALNKEQGSHIDGNSQLSNFQANPPFEETIFAEFAMKILPEILRAEAENREFGGCIVYPWRDSAAYAYLASSAVYIDEIELDKLAHYFEDTAANTHVKSKFDSFVLVIGSSLFRKRYQDQIDLADKIVEAFQVKPKVRQTSHN